MFYPPYPILRNIHNPNKWDTQFTADLKLSWEYFAFDIHKLIVEKLFKIHVNPLL